MKHSRSNKLYARACQLIPGGVNSPVRAFKGVGGNPLFLQRGEGAFVYDADNNRYIDYVGSWGPLILGHAHPHILQTLEKTAQDGTSFGAANYREIELAERVVELIPSIERIRFVNSGTEATMSALRLARGVTGRDKVIKFSGCYHGHADAFLSDAGSGIASFDIPGSSGVPSGAVEDSITVPYNDLGNVEEVFRKFGDNIAAIIVEPVACNMGLVLPQDGFLAGLRRFCDQYGALLIFDEVITGFRLGLGGAQTHYGVCPDLSTFGKIIGGGLPVGAYGGRSDYMDRIAPLGPVYQAGTLSGNPLAMAAGIVTLDELSTPGFYQNLEKRSKVFGQLMNEMLNELGNPAYFSQIGSIFHLWFKKGQNDGPKNFVDVKSADASLFEKYFKALLSQGIWIAPSPFEVGFISQMHTQPLLEATTTAVRKALESILDS